MGNRLSKIYTRTGDQGTTGLGDGSRVDKDSLRVEAMGDVDELNAIIGILLTEPILVGMRETFTAVQHDLFDLGGADKLRANGVKVEALIPFEGH